MTERAGRLIDVAVAAGLVRARAVRPGGWIRGQRCPAACERPGGQGACNYSADGRRFRCHRCDAAGGLEAWLEARGEAPERYADAPSVPPGRRRGGPLNVAAGWAALQARPGRWRDAVGDWIRDVRGWPSDLATAIVGRGGLPPIDDVAGFCTGRLPAPALALVERARRLDRHILIAQRCTAGEVRTLRFRRHASGGGQKALALPQWACGPSAAWGGLSLFGRLDRAIEAARRKRPILVVEGGPDYLVAAGLTRLGIVGAALGVPSAGELPRLATALAAGLDSAGLHAEVGLAPHRGDVRGTGVRAMAAVGGVLAARADIWWLPVPVDPHGRGDLADAAASVHTARMLAALVLAARGTREPLAS